MIAVPDRRLSWRGWWPLAAGVAAVLLTSYARFVEGIWTTPGNDHAPIIVVIALFLFWHRRKVFSEAMPPDQAWPGGALIATGLLLLLFGARTRIASFESFSHLPLLVGALWLAGGPRLVLRLWFPLFFLMLSVPIPSFLLSLATSGLKEFVSSAAVEILYRVGYPIARDGAVLTLGPYQLLVAEACAGMNSIISLSAVGLLYLYLVPPAHLWSLAAALAGIIPIAVAANVIRIVLLCLITYHLGDEAGQGFLHEFAGMAMFAFALFSFVALSALLRRIGHAHRELGGAHA